MISGAHFSGCRTWRYSLWRRWSEGTTLAVIGLNPSTADETQDDPTIRRCIRFAKDWGHGRFVMLNLFGVRSPYPQIIKDSPDPIGPDNDDTILAACSEASQVLFAWGAHDAARDRGRLVAGMLGDIGIKPICLGKTKAGFPRHPLYIKADTRPVLVNAV